MATLSKRLSSIAMRATYTPNYTPVRYATFKKIGKVDIGTKNIPTSNTKTTKTTANYEKTPMLNDVLRNLWKKVHPDLLVNYPVQKETNEKSLMTLQGMLSGLKDASGDTPYPRIYNESLIFYLRGDKPGHFKKAELLLHVNSGISKATIQKQLETFFQTTGLATSFKWDSEYFPFKTAPSKKPDAEKEAEEYESSSSHSNESYEEFQARILREKQQQS